MNDKVCMVSKSLCLEDVSGKSSNFIKVKEKSFQVCGDKALGHNFNAVTCESCKAFFRRNAISNKKFSCPFSNACEITIITRRFCQKCRLEKCFKIGMKKEYIMSEEDKEIKRLKIEHNRNKRKLKTGTEKASSDDETEQSMTKRSVRVKEEWSPGSTSSPVSTAVETQSESSMNIDSYEFQRKDPSQNISSNSSADELIEAIMQEPKEAGKVIQKVMKSKREALVVMSKIIQEPSQALILISHLIKNPSDGMIIISKMMSSPLDALSVFAQFMSSPTDALQLIFKIMSSPGSVLQFMTELTETPQKALEIMKRFMSSTNDTLTGLNQIMTSQSESSDQSDHQNEMIKSMLEVSSVDSPNSSVASPSSAFQSIRVPDSPQSLTTSYGSDFDNNNNNNDYRHNTESLLNEISHDISRKQSPFNGNSIDSIINEAIKLEYETPEMVNQIRSPHHRELSEIEILKIQELIDSNKALYAPVDDDLVSFDTDNCQIKAETGLDPTLLNVINLTAIAIRRLIKMSKKISGFKKMCQEDQIALLKVSCLRDSRDCHVITIDFIIGRLYRDDDSAECHAI